MKQWGLFAGGLKQPTLNDAENSGNSGAQCAVVTYRRLCRGTKGDEVS